MALPTFFYFYFLLKNREAWGLALRYFFIAYAIVILTGYIIFLIPQLFSTEFVAFFSFFDIGVFRLVLLQPANYLVLPALLLIKKPLNYLVILFLLFSVLISGGRTALLSAILGIIFVLFFMTQKSKIKFVLINPKLIFRLAIVFGGIFYGSSYLVNHNDKLPDFLVRFHTLVVNPERASGARLGYIDESLKRSEKNIFAFNKIYSNKELKRASSAEIGALTGRTHNQYIGSFYAFGVWGLATFLLFSISLLFSAIKNYLKYVRYSNLLLLSAALIFMRLIEALSAGSYYESFFPIILVAMASRANKYSEWFLQKDMQNV